MKLTGIEAVHAEFRKIAATPSKCAYGLFFLEGHCKDERRA